MKRVRRMAAGVAILCMGVLGGLAGADARNNRVWTFGIESGGVVHAGEASRVAVPGEESAQREKLRQRIGAFVREWYGLPETVKLDVGAVEESHFPEFLMTQVTLDDGQNQQAHPFYLSRDGRFLMEKVYRLSAHPERDVVRMIKLSDEVSKGPANAPVTLVEYADLQCASCARLHQFLKNEFLPRYGDKVRIIFKEFPLTHIHDWALAGSIASQCVSRNDPQAVLLFRDLIFTNQAQITAANARQKFLLFGEQAGANRNRLAQCFDTKATLPHVRRSVQEGRQLGVRSTPTVFINGKRVAGNASPAIFYRLVDHALQKGTRQ